MLEFALRQERSVRLAILILQCPLADVRMHYPTPIPRLLLSNCSRNPFIRSKTLSSSSSSAGNHNGTLAHSKLTSLITEEKAMNEKDKESGGSAGSGGDSPKSAGGSE